MHGKTEESVSMVRRFSRQVSDDEPEIVAVRLGGPGSACGIEHLQRTGEISLGLPKGFYPAELQFAWHLRVNAFISNKCGKDCR